VEGVAAVALVTATVHNAVATSPLGKRPSLVVGQVEA